jgi:predicted RNA-binding Zn-ribbon protein involved in translation (DUF1610 family)
MTPEQENKLAEQHADAYSMYCPECGNVVVRHYTSTPLNGKLEECEVCEKTLKFQMAP